MQTLNPHNNPILKNRKLRHRSRGAGSKITDGLESERRLPDAKARDLTTPLPRSRLSSWRLGIFNPLWSNERKALEKGINKAILGIDTEHQAGGQTFQVTLPSEWSQEGWGQDRSELLREEVDF